MSKFLDKGAYESNIEATKRRIDYIKSGMSELSKHEWVLRLNYEQWVDFKNGKIKFFDPLTIADVRENRGFNYYFNKGELVKLDYDVMDDSEKEKYSDLIGLHAVITDCYSSLHSFAHGSAYSHHVKFENGYETEPCGCAFPDMVPTPLLIPINDEESEKYIKLYKTTEDKSELWFVIN